MVMAKILQIIGLASVLLFFYLVLGWLVEGMFGFAAGDKFLFLLFLPDWLLRQSAFFITESSSHQTGGALWKVLSLSLLGAIFVGLSFLLHTFVSKIKKTGLN